MPIGIVIAVAAVLVTVAAVVSHFRFASKSERMLSLKL